MRFCLFLFTALSLFLSTALGLPAGADRAKDEQASAWISLFNGRNLDGWFIKCRPEDKDKMGYWKVEKGTITAETPPGSKHHYIWLLTEKEYGDFELRLKVQTYGRTTGNSGVQVRSRYDDDAHWLDGPQVDIHPPGPWRCGFIYDETRGAKVWLWPDVGKPSNAKPAHAPRGWTWSHADGEDVWNDVHIICGGTHIRTVVNGVTVADYEGKGRLDDAHHRRRRVGLKGHIGLQIHPGGRLRIRFKEIRIRAKANAERPRPRPPLALTVEQRKRLERALAPLHARYDPAATMLRTPFSSPGYHTTLRGGFVHRTRRSLRGAERAIDFSRLDVAAVGLAVRLANAETAAPAVAARVSEGAVEMKWGGLGVRFPVRPARAGELRRAFRASSPAIERSSSE